MTAMQIGNTTELEVQYLLVKNGYSVFTPINDGCCVDLCVIIEGIVKRVQVKTSFKSGIGFRIPLLKGNKIKQKYTNEDIDYFATTYANQLYLIPIEDVESKAHLTLRLQDTVKHNYVTHASTYKISQC